MSIFIKNRFIVFGIFILGFMTFNYAFTNSVLPSTDTKDLWFYSGLAMTLFSILFIEPYYSSPKNVITNTIPLFLVFMSIKNSFENQTFWWLGISIILSLLIFSMIAMFLEDKNKSTDDWHNLWAEKIKKYVVLLGQGKVLYSSVFIVVLLTYYSIKDLYTLTLFVIWFIIVSINPKKLTNTFSTGKRKYSKETLGTIFGVESNGIFLIKIFDDKNNINKFDTVEFIYSFENNQLTSKGLIFDTYSLNSEKWAKVLELKKENIENNLKVLDTNIIYKTTATPDLRISDFIGIVIENSSIGKIKFEYSKQNDNLEEGDLIEIKINEKIIYYQVVEGFTSSEVLESKNKSGFIRGEALQLGEWDNENLNFKKFGWVPKINTPIFTANTTSIEIPEYIYPEYRLGVIPKTQLPSVINLNEAVSHHMALIGVTGSGKSFLAREIIKELQNDTKVICIDFNKEFITTMTPPPANIISNEKAQDIANWITWISNEQEKFANQQNKAQIETNINAIKNAIKDEINIFLDHITESIKVFELPDVTNSTSILDYTKYFFKVLFEVAKERQLANNSKKIAVVIEEAHTVIPEWNFAGSSDKTSQSLVNSISQIALQGRKYGVGFMIITQRTANVSKTVLTQCNTIICFQAFDETSFTFLSNYIGKDLAQALPHLKQHHAVVTGKAIKSNLPMIIDLTRN